MLSNSTLGQHGFSLLVNLRMSVRSLTNEKARQNISITLNVEQILIYQLKWLCLIRHLSFYAPASPPDVGRTGGTAQIFLSTFRQGRALPHIRRRSRNAEPQTTKGDEPHLATRRVKFCPLPTSYPLSAPWPSCKVQGSGSSKFYNHCSDRFRRG